MHLFQFNLIYLIYSTQSVSDFGTFCRRLPIILDCQLVRLSAMLLDNLICCSLVPVVPLFEVILMLIFFFVKWFFIIWIIILFQWCCSKVFFANFQSVWFWLWLKSLHYDQRGLFSCTITLLRQLALLCRILVILNTVLNLVKNLLRWDLTFIGVFLI